jgi:preprotein translocase subunit SecD
VLSLIGATLTLPGIAGIVLTIGMAVDANVLVFERIREELRKSKGPARAIDMGYRQAWSAIVDANITTFIAAAILFAMGSGPVRGFAVTLGIGIVTSVFTALFVTRLLIVWWFERRRPRAITV